VSPQTADARHLDRMEDRMNPKKLATVAAIAALLVGILPAIAGCAALDAKLTNQPDRILRPDELPQIYRNY